MERVTESKDAVRRNGAAAQRTERAEELDQQENLAALLPEGVSESFALQLLSSAGLTLEEALAAYERGELESYAGALEPAELAALTEALGESEEGAPGTGASARRDAACSCGGGTGSKDEEEEKDGGASSRAVLAPPRRASERTSGRPRRPLILPDGSARVQAGQMRRSAFLARVEAVVRATAEAALDGSGRSARDCPYIDRALRYYRSRDSRHLERALHRYAPGAAGARSTSQYLLAIQQRVHDAASRWARTGQVTGVPRDVPAPIAAEPQFARSAASEARLLPKSADGAASGRSHPHAVRARLSEGRPLESSVRSRMESAFGASFSSVRVHTGADAAGVSSELGARAFAVGEDVAFAGGRYAPGTPVGDALIAHELAHVLQQRGSDPLGASHEDRGERDLEADADRSALAVAMALWQTGHDGAARIVRDALPQLRSGLRLSRCKDEQQTPSPAPRPAPTPAVPCKPTMRSLKAIKTGTVAMTTAWPGGNCELAFGTPSAVGMSFEAEVEVPTGCTGKLEYTQLIDRCLEKRTAGTTSYQRRKSGGYVLDNSDPYHGERVTSAGRKTIKTDDSPGADTAGWDLVHMQKDNFKMYLLWTPDSPAGSPRVGLGIVEWSWKGKATKTGSSGTCASDWTVSDTDAKGGTGTATTAVPTWTKTYPGDVPYEPGRC